MKTQYCPKCDTYNRPETEVRPEIDRQHSVLQRLHGEQLAKIPLHAKNLYKLARRLVAEHEFCGNCAPARAAA